MKSELLSVSAQAADQATEQELMRRYEDYNNALFALATGSSIVADLARKTDIEIDTRVSSGAQGQSWIDRMESTLDLVKDRISNAFNRVLGGLTEAYQDLPDFAGRLEQLKDSLASRAKEAILNALHSLFQSLSSLSTKLFSIFFGWLATVKRVAAERDFKLGKITLSLPSMGIKTVNLFGFSIPYPEISTPQIEMDFS